MFILRAAFWLCLVVFLIPGDPANGKPAPAAVAIAALQSVRGAIADVAGLCERQPDVCSNGMAALQAVAAKARVGAALFEAAVEGGNLEATGEAARGTLRLEDLGPTWRAPAPGRDA